MTLKVEIQNRSVVEKRIAGALRSAIDQHGPITPLTLGSATKRVFAVLKVLAREQAG